MVGKAGQASLSSGYNDVGQVLTISLRAPLIRFANEVNEVCST